MRKKNLQSGLMLLILMVMTVSFTYDRAPKKNIYLLQVYHLESNEQLQNTEAYLKDAYLPGLHKTGIRNVGVFKPIANDTAKVKSIYVLIPLGSEKDILQLDEKLRKNEDYIKASKDFREAPSTNPPYDRMESMILQAFNGQKQLMIQTKKEGRVFELRSYESPTERLHDKKVAMFENQEIKLFKKLDFNVVFYARVIAGGRKPNFIYMPSFESVEARNAHWKTFGADPEWKAMSSDPVNENKVSVSKIESILMKAAEYSDY